jgi:adenine-specific DNA methylase
VSPLKSLFKRLLLEKPAYNSKRESKSALIDLVENTKAKYIIFKLIDI